MHATLSAATPAVMPPTTCGPWTTVPPPMTVGGRTTGGNTIGIDALPHEGVAYVNQGILSATFQYPTGGAEAVDTVLKILKGESVPKHITLGSRSFTPENIGAK